MPLSEYAVFTPSPSIIVGAFPPASKICVVASALICNSHFVCPSFFSSSLKFPYRLAQSGSTQGYHASLHPLTSIAPQTHRSYRRRPSSLPTDVCCRRESACPLPSNLPPVSTPFIPAPQSIFQPPLAQVFIPSAGKSSNSSSSSSCAAGFFSTAGSPFLDLSSMTALVVAAEPCAAPDIVVKCRGFRAGGP